MTRSRCAARSCAGARAGPSSSWPTTCRPSGGPSNRCSWTSSAARTSARSTVSAARPRRPARPRSSARRAAPTPTSTTPSPRWRSSEPLVDWGGNCGNISRRRRPVRDRPGPRRAEEPVTGPHPQHQHRQDHRGARSRSRRTGRRRWRLRDPGRARDGRPDPPRVQRPGRFADRPAPADRQPARSSSSSPTAALRGVMVDAGNPVVFAARPRLWASGGPSCPPRSRPRPTPPTSSRSSAGVVAEMLGLVADRTERAGDPGPAEGGLRRPAGGLHDDGRRRGRRRATPTCRPADVHADGPSLVHGDRSDRHGGRGLRGGLDRPRAGPAIG